MGSKQRAALVADPQTRALGFRTWMQSSVIYAAVNAIFNAPPPPYILWKCLFSWTDKPFPLLTFISVLFISLMETVSKWRRFSHFVLCRALGKNRKSYSWKACQAGSGGLLLLGTILCFNVTVIIKIIQLFRVFFNGALSANLNCVLLMLPENSILCQAKVCKHLNKRIIWNI